MSGDRGGFEEVATIEPSAPHRLLDEGARCSPRRYIAQCALATVVIGAAMMGLNALLDTAIITSLGASTFVVFALPRSHAAGARRLIGGYALGTVAGLLCFGLAQTPLVERLLSREQAGVLFGALAIGLAALLMVTLDAEHPPGAGMTLSLVVQPWEVLTIAFVAGTIAVLALARHVLRNWLVDLTS